MRAALDGCDRELAASGGMAPVARRAGPLSAALAGAAAIVATAILVSAPTRPVAAVQPLTRPPMAARLAVSRALGGAEPQFAIARSGGGYRVRAGGGVAAEFGRGAAEVR